MHDVNDHISLYVGAGGARFPPRRRPVVVAWDELVSHLSCSLGACSNMYGILLLNGRSELGSEAFAEDGDGRDAPPPSYLQAKQIFITESIHPGVNLTRLRLVQPIRPNETDSEWCLTGVNSNHIRFTNIISIVKLNVFLCLYMSNSSD